MYLATSSVQADPDEVVGIPIREPLDVDEHQPAVHWQLRFPDYMDFPLADGKGLQGMVVPFGPCGQSLGPPARTERGCQLGYGENAFASAPCPLLVGQT